MAKFRRFLSDKDGDGVYDDFDFIIEEEDHTHSHHDHSSSDHKATKSEKTSSSSSGFSLSKMFSLKTWIIIGIVTLVGANVFMAIISFLFSILSLFLS